MLIDIILVLILISLVLSGYRKGLLMSLLGLVVVVLCCLGATAAQQTLTPGVNAYLEPKLTEIIEPEIEAYIGQKTQDAVSDAEDLGFTVGGQRLTLGDLTDLLRQFGLDVEQTVTSGTVNALEPATAAVAEALARAIAQKIAGVLVYIAAWMILYLVLQNLALALNVVDRLPVIHTFNQMGGAVLGALEGLVPMVVIAAVLDRAGLLPEHMGPVSEAIRTLTDNLL